ncbi:hypothetical protein JYK14_10510 [Siccirubricoccus sp. KC 17139]|uniref:Uncharacterized protein n=1 Tax=Siccirubricoccus soli TaxID=2899147 RepID=A0ABT1D3U8_9PROT|nr:hypothetical protein [Siccirubricoccus soli]MCO6416591.1 hypothetical protein [Siccirubricoccus soli]MCP2682726.1 hypothetical protein [Siccirubricoccus soli]
MADEEHVAVMQLAEKFARQAARPNSLFVIGAKHERERDACWILLQALGREQTNITSRDNPDCEFRLDGQRVGVEVTELTDERHIRRVMRGRPSDVTLWSDTEAMRHLQACINKKAAKSWAEDETKWHRRWLAIVCDEPHLGTSRWSGMFEAARLNRHWFDRVFVITYDPGRSRYAVCEVP